LSIQQNYFQIYLAKILVTSAKSFFSNIETTIKKSWELFYDSFIIENKMQWDLKDSEPQRLQTSPPKDVETLDLCAEWI